MKKKVIYAVLQVRSNSDYPTIKLTLENDEEIIVEIRDSSFFDTWVYDNEVGDINLWVDENEDGEEEVILSIYPDSTDETTNVSEFYRVPLTGDLTAGLEYFK